jgi:hypothetical protein
MIVSYLTVKIFVCFVIRNERPICFTFMVYPSPFRLSAVLVDTYSVVASSCLAGFSFMEFIRLFLKGFQVWSLAFVLYLSRKLSVISLMPVLILSPFICLYLKIVLFDFILNLFREMSHSTKTISWYKILRSVATYLCH